MRAQESQHPSILDGIVQTMGMLQLVAAVPASVYRLAMNTRMGNRDIGAIQLVGVFFAYPLAVLWWPPGGEYQAANAVALWYGLMALLFLQGVASRFAPRTRHSHDIGVPWSGKSEPFFVVVGVLALAALCGPGPACFFAAGAVGNVIQIWTIQTRHKRMAQMAHDQRAEGEAFKRYMADERPGVERRMSDW